MSVDRFIAELQERNWLSDRLLARLRKTVAESDRPLSPQAIAKFLVQKEHLSQRQASEVLSSLLASGVDIDDAIRDHAPPITSRRTHADPTSVIESETNELADDDAENSSIFAPYLTGNRKKTNPVAPVRNHEDELSLLPDDDAAAPNERIDSRSRSQPVESPVRRDLSVSNEVSQTKVITPINADAQPKRSGTERNEMPDATPNATDLKQLRESSPRGLRKTTTLRRSKKTKEAKKKSKPAKRQNQWDSPLILLGGGGLVLLALSGATVWWLINWQSGDQQLSLAGQAADSGAYAQAIEYYEQFLDGSPRHAERSLARVKLGMVRLRQATESANYPAALALAESELKEIEDEENFGDAQSELAALLPQIALGLSRQAEAAAPGAADADELGAQTEKALALCNNVNYVPKSLRNEATLTEVREALERTKRRQQTHRVLQDALASMQQAVSAGDTRQAYSVHRQLLREYPQLAGDAGLADLVKKTTTAEQAAIRFVSEEQAAETNERPTPWVAALALAHRRGTPPAAESIGTACVRVDGAAYGLDAATGRLLWRRHVGYASAAQPIRLDRDVLLTDGPAHELLRLEAASGRLLWRQTIGEPFAQPLVVGQRGFVATESGRLYVIDLKSGARMGFLQFAQPLRVQPVVDRQSQRLYLTGDQSSLYSISLADLSCLGVYYMGHAEGSIRVPPAHVLDKLAVLENDGVETSRLRLMSIESNGAVSKQDAERRLNGLAVDSPLVAGRRLLVVTDRGQIEVYDVGSSAGDDALTLVATRDAAGRQPLARHVAVVGRHIWVGDTQLTKYSILPTGNRLPAESIENNFAGAAFDHPFELFGNLIVHVRRPKGRAGAVVAATDTKQGKVHWETDLAIPPAGPPVVDQTAKALTVANAEGNVFRFDDAAIRSRVQDQPLSAESVEAELPALATSVDLGQGRAAFCAAGADRLLLYNPNSGNGAVQTVKLVSPLACDVTPLGDGLIAPLAIGQVFYLSSADGRTLATPFQPRLEPRTTVSYRPAGVVDAAARRFVITDGREKIYLVAAVDQPQPHLEAITEASAGPFPIESPVVVVGDVALAVAGESHVVRFRLPSLEPAGELNLDAPVVWGPFRVGDAVLLATADGQLRFVSAAGEEKWRAQFEHGDLAGAPLALESGVLIAYRRGIVERRATSDGNVLGSVDIAHPLAVGPVPFLHRIVLAAQDGTLLVVDQP